MYAFGIITHFIDGIGRRFISTVNYTLQMLLMTYLSFRSALQNEAQSLRAITSVILLQVYFTGVQALSLISVIAVASSTIAVMQSASQFSFLGGSEMVGQLLVTIVIRELAPLITALIVIARSGTAVASELGNMRVNREIEALESLGINPLSYIVFPRLMGGILSVICLSLYYAFFAIIGGFVFSKILLNMPLSYFLDSIVQAITVEDVYMFAVKILFSGFLIFAISCHQGLQVKNGPHEVPQATTKAVVNSIIYVMAFHILTTALFYFSRLVKLGLI